MVDLAAKQALFTGASAGIGREIGKASAALPDVTLRVAGGRVINALVVAAAMIAFGASEVLGLLPRLPGPAVMTPAFTWFAIAFGAFLIAGWAPLVARIGRPGLIVTATSLNDLRLSPDVIPWREVRSITLWHQNRRDLGVHLVITPEFEQTYRRYGLQRLVAALNRSTRYTRGLWLTAPDGQTNARQLCELCLRYWNAYTAANGAPSV